jgi:hypothetical protein
MPSSGKQMKAMSTHKPITSFSERRKVMKKNLFITGLVMITLFVGISSVTAQVPQTINYQGRLSMPGTCSLDTTISMTFGIYADPTTTTSLWCSTEAQDIWE